MTEPTGPGRGRTVADQGVVTEDAEEVCRRLGAAVHLLDGRTLLVAGGAGFLPSYFLDVVAHANDTLLETPCRIISVDNYITGVENRAAHLRHREEFRFMTHDITRELSLNEPVDYIIHGASIASPPMYRRYPLQTIEVNTRGTQNLLELARRVGVKGFLYLSSSEIYGDPPPEHVPTPETYWGNVSCTGPRACYDESKRLAETLCMVYYQQWGVPVKIVRPFNVYGPGLRLDDGRVIPDFFRAALAGGPIIVHSGGTPTRSFCYISDAVTAMLLLLVSDYTGEAFNVGNDEELSIGYVAKHVASLAGTGVEVRFQPSDDPNYLLDNPQRRCPDLTKTRRCIPWQPSVILTEGLRRTLQWYVGGDVPQRRAGT